MVVLELKDVGYSIGNVDILNDISIAVNCGDCISVVGSSGSGKSTLLKLCADLISPSAGQILYRGTEYKSCDPLELRKKISYILQTPHLFGSRVSENLEFPFSVRGDAVDSEVIEYLLDRFGLDKRILQSDIESLSGGEKQRISIARSLIYTPDILLLDEPTSALDSANTERVESLIAELNSDGVTVLWITHDMEQSSGIFNKRFTLRDGKIEQMEVFR